MPEDPAGTAAPMSNVAVLFKTGAHCGHCDTKIVLVDNAECPECKEPITQIALGYDTDEPLSADAAIVGRAYPNLTFIGIAELTGLEARPCYTLVVPWPPAQ